jgi:hypothetical protein
MAAPAKLEFDSWIETVRKHLELSQQPPHTGRRNLHRGKHRQPTEIAPAREALESLKSLHEEMVVRAAAIEPAIPPNSPLNASFDPELAQQVSSQVADQVVAALTAQLSQQVTEQISALFETKLKQFNALDARVTENASAEDTDALAKRIAELEQELRELQSCSHTSEEQLRLSADEGEARLTAVQEELALAHETIALLEMRLADSKNTDWSVNKDGQTTESALIAELEAEIVSLQTTLAASRSDCWQVSAPNADADKLAAQLADLKQRNSELASQLAEAQSSLHNPPHLYLSTLNQESMTWEQRKKLIMQQFENETAAESHADPTQSRIDIDEMLRTTQAEIDRRDKEIEELKAIVVQQSNTHEGVAIGAAAIAQMLDSDELVKLEREKLAAIQREWEGKLREAEIQISTERARLSRERAELESQSRLLAEQLVNLPQQPPAPADTKIDGKPVRRWLEHLGLRDK